MRIWTLIATLSVMAVAAGAADEPSSGVIFIDHDKMAAGFAKGGTQLNNGAYQILTSHRVGTGMVEVHAQYGQRTSYYVVEGSATVITGRTVVDGETTCARARLRGASITGRKSNHPGAGRCLQ